MADEKRGDYQRELKAHCDTFLASHGDSVVTEDLYEFVREHALASFKNGKSAGIAHAKKNSARE